MIIERPLPVNLIDRDKYLFQHEIHREIPQSKILSFINSFCTAEGVAFKKFKVFPESYSAALIAKNVTWKFFVRAFLLNKKFKITDNSILVIDSQSGGYFHWMLDTLPRIFAARKYWGTHKVLINPACNTTYHRDTLSALNVKRTTLLPGVTYSFDNLAISTHMATTGNYDPDLLSEVRKFFLDIWCQKIEYRKKRLYITRRNAHRRKVLNEIDVIECLKKYRFEVVEFETIPLQQQAQTVFEASHIIGQHGAGLSNMLFASEDCRVLELRRKHESHDNCFFSLAGALSLPYYYLQCEPDSPNKSNQDADISVNIKELDQTVTAFLQL